MHKTRDNKWSQKINAFYKWFHEHSKSGILIDTEREAFLAGWDAHAASVNAYRYPTGGAIYYDGHGTFTFNE